MGQAILETLFDVAYLSGVLTVGFLMLRRANGRPLVRLFGAMAVVLGAGDAFHLVPRVWSLWTGGLEANAAALGIGKLITSITMTVFYLLLYYVWRERYRVTGRRGLTAVLWGLSALRVALCLLPQNDWLTFRQPLLWGILRNLPFAAMGVILIVAFYLQAKRANDRVFGRLWLAILLSFGFYAPVVFWGETVPLVGMLMIPKTLAYVWVVWMGWQLAPESGREAA
ncbi:MAG: hypothetical protein GX418_01545 [Clostridiales bacterium]|nr:hypothetical protein [Clostridiales bacterium]